MTPEDFHRFLCDPATGPTLDRLLAADAALDAEIAERQQRELNEEIYLRAIRNYWRRTDATVGEP